MCYRGNWLVWRICYVLDELGFSSRYLHTGCNSHQTSYTIGTFSFIYFSCRKIVNIFIYFYYYYYYLLAIRL